jgi:hypothetical protein
VDIAIPISQSPFEYSCCTPGALYFQSATHLQARDNIQMDSQYGLTSREDYSIAPAVAIINFGLGRGWCAGEVQGFLVVIMFREVFTAMTFVKPW